MGHGPGLTSNHGTMIRGKQDNQAVETVPISIGRLMIGRLMIAHFICVMFVSLFSADWKIIYIVHVAKLPSYAGVILSK